MIKRTTKQKIMDYLKYRSWTSGSELESLASAWGTKSSVISRRARELAEEGLIQRSMSERKTVQYRHKNAREYVFTEEQLKARQGVLDV